MKHTEGTMASYSKGSGQGMVIVTEMLGMYIAALDTSAPATKANAERIVALWNAAEGLTNEEAVERLQRKEAK